LPSCPISLTVPWQNGSPYCRIVNEYDIRLSLWQLPGERDKERRYFTSRLCSKTDVISFSNEVHGTSQSIQCLCGIFRLLSIKTPSLLKSNTGYSLSSVNGNVTVLRRSDIYCILIVTRYHKLIALILSTTVKTCVISDKRTMQAHRVLGRYDKHW